MEYGNSSEVKFTGEFCWELLWAVPDAYQSHLSDTLKKVICKDTAPFYYFCSNIEQFEGTRNSAEFHSLQDVGRRYDYDLDVSHLHPFPPYKEHYSRIAKKMGIPNTKKKIIVINNKSMMEHGPEAHNRFSLADLEMIANHYSDSHIYYLRPRSIDFEDDALEAPFKDKEFMRSFSNVSVDEDLMKEWDVDFNTMQLIAHSVSNRFFSVGGGNAFISSIFGGVNTILTVHGPVGYCNRGVWKTGSYLTHFSGAEIIGVKNSEELRESLGCNSVHIRPMVEEDISFFNEVRNECSEWLHDPSTYTVEQSLSWFKQNKNPFFICEIDGKKAGYFRTSNWEDSSCYIGMDISKDYRGKNLATTAYEMFMTLLHRDFNINTFKLEVLDKNTRARTLYVNLGFKRISEHKHGKDISIVMEKEYE